MSSIRTLRNSDRGTSILLHLVSRYIQKYMEINAQINKNVHVKEKNCNFNRLDLVYCRITIYVLHHALPIAELITRKIMV